VWSGIENRELVLHIGSAISYNPAVIRTVVSMRCPAHVNYAVEQSQARPLVFNKDIKRNISTRRPVSGSRRASADLDWSAELLITGHEIDRMQALVENRSRALRLTYHVEGVGAAVDDRGACDSNLWRDVIGRDRRGCYRDLATGSAMCAIN